MNSSLNQEVGRSRWNRKRISYFFQYNNYRRQWSCGKVMFLHLCVIMFTGGVGLCLGMSLSRGCLCPGGLCLGVSVWGSLSRGLCVQGDMCSAWSLSGRPPYGNVWAVHILPECILVYKYNFLAFCGHKFLLVWKFNSSDLWSEESLLS